MFCEKCGTQLNDSDKFCPKCGSLNSADQAAADQAVNQAAVEQNADQAVPASESAAPAQEKEAAKPAPKKSKKLLMGVGCVAVIVVAVMLISGLGNFFRRTFSAPEKYYAYVEKQQVEELAAMFSAYYDNYVKDTQVTNYGAEMEILVELGEDIRALMGYADVDVDWLKSVALALETDIKDEKIGLAATLKANKESILSAKGAVDLTEEAIYLQLPELNKKYLGVDFKDADIDYDDDIWEQLEGATKNLPASKKIEKLLQKYIGMALTCVEEVEKEKDTLKAEGVSAKYTALEVTIDQYVLRDMFEVVFEAMIEDKDLEELIVQLAGASEGMDGDDAYDEMISGLKYALDNLDDVTLRDDIVMTIWVDKDGTVKGRQIEIGEVEISYAMPQKGSKFGFEFKVDDGSSSISVDGSGKKSSKKLSGEFAVKYDSARIVDIVVEDFYTEKLKDGYLNGKFTVSLAGAAGTLLRSVVPSSLSGMVNTLAEYAIVLDVESSGKSAKSVISILDGEEKLISVKATAKTGKGSKVSVPSSKNVIEASDIDELEEWVEDADFDKLLKKLEDKVDVPSDYIDLIEMILENYLDY